MKSRRPATFIHDDQPARMMRVKSVRFGVGWICSSNPGLKRQGTAKKPEL